MVESSVAEVERQIREKKLELERLSARLDEAKSNYATKSVPKAPPPVVKKGAPPMFKGGPPLKKCNIGKKSTAPKQKMTNAETLQLHWPTANGMCKTTLNIHETSQELLPPLLRKMLVMENICSSLPMGEENVSIYNSDASDMDCGLSDTNISLLKEWFKRRNTPALQKKDQQPEESASGKSLVRPSCLGASASQRITIAVNFFRKAFAQNGGWQAFKQGFLNCSLSKDAINLVMDLVPDPAEGGSRRLQEWDELKGKVLQFRIDHPTEVLLDDEDCVLFLSSIPDVKFRLQCLSIKACFEEILGGINSKFDCLFEAMEVIRTMPKLPLIFKLILATGNVLNAGTLLGNRMWFRLNALQRVCELKGTGPNAHRSLLRFLAEQIGEVCNRKQLQILQKAKEFSIVNVYVSALSLIETYALVSASRTDSPSSSEQIMKRKRRRSHDPGAEDVRDRFAEKMGAFAADNRSSVCALMRRTKDLVQNYSKLSYYLGDVESVIPIDKKVTDEAGQPSFVVDIFTYIHNFLNEYSKAVVELEREKEKSSEKQRKNSLKDKENTSNSASLSAGSKNPKESGSSVIRQAPVQSAPLSPSVPDDDLAAQKAAVPSESSMPPAAASSAGVTVAHPQLAHRGSGRQRKVDWATKLDNDAEALLRRQQTHDMTGTVVMLPNVLYSELREHCRHDERAEARTGSVGVDAQSRKRTNDEGRAGSGAVHDEVVLGDQIPNVYRSAQSSSLPPSKDRSREASDLVRVLQPELPPPRSVEARRPGRQSIMAVLSMAQDRFTPKPSQPTPMFVAEETLETPSLPLMDPISERASSTDPVSSDDDEDAACGILDFTSLNAKR